MRTSHSPRGRKAICRAGLIISMLAPLGCGGSDGDPTATGTNTSNTAAPASGERDYLAEWRALAASGQPEGENAWPLIAAAAEAVKAVIERHTAGRESKHVDFRSILTPISGLDSPDAIALATRVLSELETGDAYAHLRRVGATVRCEVPLDVQDGRVPSGSFPELKFISSLAHARVISAIRSLQRSRADSFVAGIEDVIVLTRHLSHDPRLLTYLTACTYRDMAVRAIAHACAVHDLTDEQVRRLYGVLDRNPVAPRSKPLAGLELHTRQTIDLVFGPQGRPGSIPPSEYIADSRSALMSPQSAPLTPEMLPSFDEMMAAHEAHWQWILEDAERPWWDRRVTRDWGKMEANRLGPRYTIVSFNIDTLPTILNSYGAFRLRETAARIILAAEHHRLTTGDPPSSLVEIEGGLLDRVPVDPITGKPFGYRVLTNDRLGRKYLLYSVGLDGEDNGGRGLRESGDLVIQILDDLTRGYDLPLNVPWE